MKLAAIDIGSNSIHMVVAHIDGDGNFDVIAREKEMVRLGERSLSDGYLGEDAQRRGVETLTETTALRDCRIVIEAGELRPESPLRKICERAKNAVAIGCYPDTERDLTKLIEDELRVSNLRLAQDARAVLMSLLGGDRMASRNELRKLALFAHGKGEITLDDVMTVVSDASELKLDPIVPSWIPTRIFPSPKVALRAPAPVSSRA